MKFFLGDTLVPPDQQVVDWIQKTFDASRYQFVKQGYGIEMYFVEFDQGSDATLFRLRWPD